MKRLLLLSLAFILLCLPADLYARGACAAAAGGGAATCTEVYSLGATGATNQVVANAAGTEYIAGQFIAGDWGTISKIQLYLQKKDGTSDLTGHTWRIAIWSDSSDDPGSIVANGSCTFAAPNTTIPAFGAPAYVGCVLTTPVQLTNTTKYHVGLDRGGTYDATHAVRWSFEATGTAGYDFNKDADGSGSWTAIDFDADVRFKLFTGAGCTND
jgi:hypothetical protein